MKKPLSEEQRREVTWIVFGLIGLAFLALLSLRNAGFLPVMPEGGNEADQVVFVAAGSRWRVENAEWADVGSQKVFSAELDFIGGTDPGQPNLAMARTFCWQHLNGTGPLNIPRASDPLRLANPGVIEVRFHGLAAWEGRVARVPFDGECGAATWVQVPDPVAVDATFFLQAAGVKWALINRHWRVKDRVSILDLDLVHVEGGTPLRAPIELGAAMCTALLRDGGADVGKDPRGHDQWEMRLRFHFQDGTRTRLVRVKVRGANCQAPGLIGPDLALADVPNLFATNWEREAGKWTAYVDLVPDADRDRSQPPPISQAVAICHAIVGRLPSPLMPQVPRPFSGKVVLRDRLENGDTGPAQEVAVKRGICLDPTGGARQTPTASERTQAQTQASIKTYMVGAGTWSLGRARYLPETQGYRLIMSFTAYEGDGALSLSPGQMRPLCRAILHDLPPGAPDGFRKDEIARLQIQVRTPGADADADGWSKWVSFDLQGKDCWGNASGDIFAGQRRWSGTGRGVTLDLDLEFAGTDPRAERIDALALRACITQMRALPPQIESLAWVRVHFNDSDKADGAVRAERIVAVHDGKCSEVFAPATATPYGGIPTERGVYDKLVAENLVVRRGVWPVERRRLVKEDRKLVLRVWIGQATRISSDAPMQMTPLAAWSLCNALLDDWAELVPPGMRRRDITRIMFHMRGDALDEWTYQIVDHGICRLPEGAGGQGRE